MQPRQIAIQTASLRQPLKKALHTAATLGASAVEIDARTEIIPAELTRTGVRHLRKMLEDLNLRVAALTFRTRRGYDVLDDLDRRIAATKQAMKAAYQLGAGVVVNQIGQVPAESTGPAWDLLQAALSDLGRTGQHEGALLAAETGTESGADLARLLNALEVGGVGATLDPGNLIINNFSPRDALSALGQHVLHVHAKDGVRDLAQGRGVEVPLGRGSADFPTLAVMLDQQPYRGYYVIERDNAHDPVTEIGQAVEYLHSLMTM